MKKILPVFLPLLLPFLSFAQWNTDSTVRNPVCIATNSQFYPRNCSDGSGGSIFVWVDERNNASAIKLYAQRITVKGKTLWATNGVIVPDDPGGNIGYDYGTIVADGSGGAIIVSEISVNGGTRQLFAQHINSSGASLWGNGIRLTDVIDSRLRWAEDPEQAGISADGAGGVFITWQAYQSPYFIYAQHIDANGNLLWGSSGVGMPLIGTADGYRSTIQNTGNGTAVVGYSNLGGGSYYMQRIAANGAYLWGSSGLLISNNYATQDFEPAHIIRYDANKSVILTAFLTQPSATSNLYVQKIDLNGNILWGAGGKNLTNSAAQNMEPDILPDNKGGLFLCYDSSINVMVQHVNTSGKKLWGVNGTKVDNTVGTNQHSPVLVSDGSSGIITVYKTSRNGAGYYSIYTQRFSSAGATVWRANGVPVIIAYADINHEVNNTVPSTKGYAITCWHDSRNAGDNNDIYAARVGGTTGLGFVPQTIVANDTSLQNTIARNAGSLNIPIKISDNAAALQQNSPNPFHQTTIILYTLPAHYSSAKIILVDKAGKLLKEIAVSGTGRGSINIDASNWANGVYQYSLYVDGKLVATRQMEIIR